MCGLECVPGPRITLGSSVLDVLKLAPYCLFFTLKSKSFWLKSTFDRRDYVHTANLILRDFKPMTAGS